MLCEGVLGNIKNGSVAAIRQVRDILELRWFELDRRALRRTTRGGRELRILLPLGQVMNDADILFDDGEMIVVVSLLPAEVLVVEPTDVTEMGQVCLAVGNLHAPAQVTGTEVLIAPDGPIEQALQDMNIAYRQETRLFTPQRCAGMPVLQISPELVRA